MRLWSDTITHRHVWLAERDGMLAGVLGNTSTYVLKSWAARRRVHGHEVTMTGYGARHTRYKNLGTAERSGWSHAESGVDKAATWMDWGWLLASLFRFDPNMRTTFYDDRDDFLTQTAAHWPHRLKVDARHGAGDFARTYAARTYTSPFELVDEVVPPIHLIDLADPNQVRAHLRSA